MSLGAPVRSDFRMMSQRRLVIWLFIGVQSEDRNLKHAVTWRKQTRIIGGAKRKIGKNRDWSDQSTCIGLLALKSSASAEINAHEQAHGIPLHWQGIHMVSM